jgi:Lon-like ATP-dependent protease
MIEIIPTETLSDVLENILISGSNKDKLIEKMKDIGSKVAEKVPQTTLNNPTTN